MADMFDGDSETLCGRPLASLTTFPLGFLEASMVGPRCRACEEVARS